MKGYRPTSGQWQSRLDASQSPESRGRAGGAPQGRQARPVVTHTTPEVSSLGPDEGARPPIRVSLLPPVGSRPRGSGFCRLFWMYLTHPAVTLLVDPI